MRIDKPMCNFINCKYHQDGNCVNASRYENCTLTDLHSEIARLRVEIDNAKADIAKEFTCVFGTPHKVSDCPINDEIAKAKADTVRKMQERLNEHFSCHDGVWYGAVVYDEIDEIAKEMSEGENEN